MAKVMQLQSCKNGFMASEQELLLDSSKERELDPPLFVSVKAVSEKMWI